MTDSAGLMILPRRCCSWIGPDHRKGIFALNVRASSGVLCMDLYGVEPTGSSATKPQPVSQYRIHTRTLPLLRARIHIVCTEYCTEMQQQGGRSIASRAREQSREIPPKTTGRAAPTGLPCVSRLRHVDFLCARFFDKILASNAPHAVFIHEQPSRPTRRDVSAPFPSCTLSLDGAGQVILISDLFS
ncbi:hypothetical protein CPSG_02354 [Coccidioides posadasii str. Silveira]|uniref:Uncharacterized protein n=2 Tax=Coccidioides posadasii TaxID=199306 RepID=E9CZ67_COCPS|nr:hypothetical protein CPSG_02354 [Coccidioides posadasii str. Silveira]KMM72922.1 hypothetical protein CPAG_09212 [Coccidioides posadasii RMSCC 3488]